MKTLTLKRPKERFNKHQPYKIMMGNTLLTWLSNGEEKVVDVPKELQDQPLKAKILWCGSESVVLSQLSEYEAIVFRGSRLNNYMPLLGGTISIVSILFFSMSDYVDEVIATGMVVFTLSIVLSTFTIWRNKWLKLETQQKEEPALAASV
jgi:hypothetical protein